MNASVDASIIDRATAWARAEATRGAASGRLLTDRERRVARAAGITRLDEVRVVKSDRVPFPETDPLLTRLCRDNGFLGPETLGLTLDHTLFLTPATDNNAGVFAHECCHVAQVERIGSLRAFIDAYIRQILAYGYAFAPLEIEAVQTGRDLTRGDAESRWTARNRTDGYV